MADAATRGSAATNPTLFHLSYMPALDGLRALAVAMVLLRHATVPGALGGFIGVDLFFALSGFLITAMLIEEAQQSSSIRLGHFYWRRIVRLMPPLVVMLAAFFIFERVFEPERSLSVVAKDIAWGFSYISNWSLLWFGLPDRLDYLWSLAVEEQFYLVWPAALLLSWRFARTRGVIAFVLIATLALLLWRSYLADTLLGHNGGTMRMYLGTDTRAFGLAIGAVLAVALAGNQRFYRWVTQSSEFERLAPLLGVVSLGSIIVLARYLYDFTYFAMKYGIVLVEVFTVLLILSFHSHSQHRLFRFFKMPTAVTIGRMSYGLYLWHHPIFFYMRRSGQPWYLIVIVGGSATLLCTWLSYRIVERPLLARSKRRGLVADQPTMSSPATHSA